MTSLGNDDENVREMDELMADDDIENGSQPFGAADDMDDEFGGRVDFSDERYERRAGDKDRRSPMFGDRRKQDRRHRASRDSGKTSKSKVSVDPMNIYLREMGTLTLLNHAEELKLAKMMEDGKRRVQNAVLKTPLAIPALLEIVRGLDNNNDKICQIITGITENTPSIVKRESKEFLECVDKAVELNGKREGLLAEYLKLDVKTPEAEQLFRKSKRLERKYVSFLSKKIYVPTVSKR